MKFTYAYKTSDGVRHEDSMSARSREEVFEALRARGIRAIKVVAADGSKANGAVYGVRKGVVVVTVVVVAAVAGFLSYVGGMRAKQKHLPSDDVPNFVADTTRRQLIGDAAVIELGVKDGWSDVFVLEGDRFLAGFCIPGAQVAVRSVTEDELRRALSSDVQLKLPNSELSLEQRQIVSIVHGMKKEIRDLLASGWTLKDVGDALVARQEKEISLYNRAKTELEVARNTKLGEDDFVELWKKRNDELRAMGIRLVPLPE